VDVSNLPPDSTKDMWLELEDGSGRLHLLLTLTALAEPPEPPPSVDLARYHSPSWDQRVADLHWRNTFADLNDVGQLEVKVNRPVYTMHFKLCRHSRS
jgi:hypothetical protein